MIRIISGPIRSGKTTRLTTWVKHNQDCKGVLSPVISNRRYIHSIHTGEYRCLEVDKDKPSEHELITIGRYRFFESTFAWARKQLEIAAREKSQWLIIDEIGPLELAGKGLEPQVGIILTSAVNKDNHNLILVIRDSLLEAVINYYHLQNKYHLHSE